MEALADKYAEVAYEEKNTPILISHGDCEADAKYLAELLMKRHGVEPAMITEIGPIIGSHAGPGTLAFFFIGNYLYELVS